MVFLKQCLAFLLVTAYLPLVIHVSGLALNVMYSTYNVIELKVLLYFLHIVSTLVLEQALVDVL